MSGSGMPWPERSKEESRLEFCRLADGLSESSFTQLCERFEVSRATGYKWLGRYRALGVEGLVDRRRVPLSSPNRTPAVVEELVVGLRLKHPAWGGRKIHHRLKALGHEQVPAPSTITGILRRHGLLAKALPHAGGFTSFEADAPNDMWQMDHKGWFMTNEAKCVPFDVLDDHSRFSLVLEACADQQATTVKHLLTGAFHRYGLPKRILCDNGGPWGNTHDGLRWTRLTVWLFDLGITVVHSRPRHPQTMGKDERFHRTMIDEVISKYGVWDSLAQVQTAFNEWQPIYNHERPHESLGYAVPASRYEPSPRSMPTNVIDAQYPSAYMTRAVTPRGRIKIGGKRYRIGQAFGGKRVALQPTNTDSVFDVLYRHETIRTITLQ